MQKIITRNFGTIEFIRTWTDGTVHIGKTKNGGYRHIGGPPVQNLSDFDAIPYGPYKDEALAWFAAKEAKAAKQTNAVVELAAAAIAPVEDDEPEPEPAKPTVTGIDVKVCPICRKELKNSLGLASHMKTHARSIKNAEKHPLVLDDVDVIDPDEPREIEV